MSNSVIPISLPVQESFEKGLNDYVFEKVTEIVENIAIKINPVSISKDVMNIKEVCTWLGITEPTLNKWVKSGLPKHKIGNVVLYVREEILSFIILLPAD